MKIITLNTWGGRVEDEFANFLKKYSDTDVFCFQEVYKDPTPEMLQTHYAHIANLNSFYTIEKLLPDHELIFHPSFLDCYGICIALKKPAEILKSGELFIFKHKGYVPEGDLGRHARNLQYATIKLTPDSKPLTIINVHGLWTGQGKTDSNDRLEQSNIISNFIKSLNTEIIMCGDFNLRPDTQSMSIIEQAGVKNLIKEYNISSTRTSLYTKSEKYADYIFISDNLKESEFKVLPDEASDHSALMLTI
jgi:endonuclease/exonuclease/phosphatase family metal-dependent hydrolase